MSGEPQLPDAGDDLDRSLHALRAIWFGMFAGGFVITLTLAMVVMSGGGGVADLGPAKYVFLLPAPFGLFAAFVLASWLTAPDPSSTDAGATATKPDDAMRWYPAFVSRFFLRAGFLEGTAILCAIGFFITGDWAILAGPVILLAALLASVPTRAAVESFAEAARQKLRSRE